MYLTHSSFIIEQVSAKSGYVCQNKNWRDDDLCQGIIKWKSLYTLRKKQTLAYSPSPSRKMEEINNSSPYKQRDIRGWGTWLMVTNASPTLVKSATNCGYPFDLAHFWVIGTIVISRAVQFKNILVMPARPNKVIRWHRIILVKANCPVKRWCCRHLMILWCLSSLSQIRLNDWRITWELMWPLAYAWFS